MRNAPAIAPMIAPVIAKTACIGAGNVGRAWAVVFARAGCAVALYDASEEAVERRALPAARTTLELLRRAGFLDEDVDAVLARIRPARSVADAVEGAGYVQESVREDVTIKRDVFAEIAAKAGDDCLLASSTSAIPGSDFMGHVNNPARAFVAHPVNPPSLIPLVELCPSRWTGADMLARARAFLEGAGMKPVMVRKEIDGFILNRLQYTLVAEAMHLVGEGYCSVEDIDRVVTDGLALRWASIGPFEVAHLNSTQGFEGFADQLGGMMKTIGRDAKTDYGWGDDLVKEIHGRLAARSPVNAIPDRQAWRDGRILAARAMQDAGSAGPGLAGAD